MKAKVPCKIISTEGWLSPAGEKMVKLTLRADGKTIMDNGKLLDCELEAKLLVKPIVVENLRLGAIINVNIESE